MPCLPFEIFWLAWHRRNGVAIRINKNVWNAVLGCNLKNNRMTSVHFQGKTIQYYSNPSLWSDQECWRSWTVLWRPTRPSRTNTQKDVFFIIRNWNAKVGSQEIPGVRGKCGFGIQNKAGKTVIEFCQENALAIANNAGEDSTHGHHQMANTEIRLIIFFAAKDGEALHSQQK